MEGATGIAGVRVGLGCDVHRLVAGRPLVLGGVRIEYERGLLGHSDGDVLLHAVADAVLGAAGQGDIGEHFPDTDPRHEGIASADILADALRRARGVGLHPVNVDVVLVAEQPRLGPWKARIREHLAALLGLAPEAVNIKAKTAEGLGDLGAGLAVACQAVVLMDEDTHHGPSGV